MGALQCLLELNEAHAGSQQAGKVYEHLLIIIVIASLKVAIIHREAKPHVSVLYGTLSVLPLGGTIYNATGLL